MTQHTCVDTVESGYQVQIVI